MKEIRDNKGKLVCKADSATKTVEIIKGKNKTIVSFTPNGEIKSESTEIEHE